MRAEQDNERAPWDGPWRVLENQLSSLPSSDLGPCDHQIPADLCYHKTCPPGK